MKLSQNVQKVGRQPPDIYSVWGEKFSVPLFYEPDVPGQRKLYTVVGGGEEGR